VGDEDAAVDTSPAVRGQAVAARLGGEQGQGLGAGDDAVLVEEQPGQVIRALRGQLAGVVHGGSVVTRRRPDPE